MTPVAAQTLAPSQWIQGDQWILGDPAWLLLLLALPAVAWLRGRRGHPVIVLPHAVVWSGESRPWRAWGVLLFYAGIGCLVIGLARPQRIDEREEIERSGYDIVLAIDISGSMLSHDYERDGERIGRLAVIKPVVEAFAARRPGDRIGIVVFARDAYTLSPLTFDHAFLRRQLGRLRAGLLEEGTAVGNALSLGVSRLEQPARHRQGERLGGFVVLLTDGRSNAGHATSQQAAQLAAARGIPVFAVGVGKEGLVPMPSFDRRGRRTGFTTVRSHLDEDSLREVALTTGGAFFRAEELAGLEKAFEHIHRRNPIRFEPRVERRTRELFQYAAWPGVLLCALALGVERSRRSR